MKKLRKITLTILTLILAFTLVACGAKKEEEKKPEAIKITDSYGTELVFEKAPEKVVSLSPGATETIYALGKEKVLVGRSDYDDYPVQVKDIKSVGGVQDPSVEKIVELKPDLVIGGAHFPKETAKKLQDSGIKVAVLYGADDFDGAYKNINDIAVILGAKAKGEEIVSSMKKKVEEVEKKVKALKAQKIYYVVGFGKSEFTAGGDTFIGKTIDKANGENIAKDTKGWSFSYEKIVEKNPDIIVISNKYDSKKKFTSDSKYKDLQAVKNNKVYEIDDNMLSRQGPRQADGLEALAKILHPDAFK